MARYLSRRVIDARGQAHSLSVVESFSGGRPPMVTPFTAETHSTAMVDGTIIVNPDGTLTLRRPGHRDVSLP